MFRRLQSFHNICSLEPCGNPAKPPECFPDLMLHGNILKAVMQGLAYSQNYFQ